MENFKILYNNVIYTIYVNPNVNENLDCIICDGAGYVDSIIEYIPCGGERYDYNAIQLGTLDIETIEYLMDMLTDRLMEEE